MPKGRTCRFVSPASHGGQLTRHGANDQVTNFEGLSSHHLRVPEVGQGHFTSVQKDGLWGMTSHLLWRGLLQKVDNLLPKDVGLVGTLKKSIISYEMKSLAISKV